MRLSRLCLLPERGQAGTARNRRIRNTSHSSERQRDQVCAKHNGGTSGLPGSWGTAEDAGLAGPSIFLDLLFSCLTMAYGFWPSISTRNVKTVKPITGIMLQSTLQSSRINPQTRTIAVIKKNRSNTIIMIFLTAVRLSRGLPVDSVVCCFRQWPQAGPLSKAPWRLPGTFPITWPRLRRLAGEGES